MTSECLNFKNLVNEKYENSLTVEEFVNLIKSEYLSKNYSPSDAVTAVSLCRDDSMSLLLNQLSNAGFENQFSLRAFTGLPIVGNTGFLTYYKHLFNRQNEVLPGLVIFAPHIGVSKTGKFGYLDRKGHTCPSNSCGANHFLIDFFKNYRIPTKEDPELRTVYDLVLSTGKVDSILKASSPIEELVETEYALGSDIVEKTILKIKESENIKHDILVVCGVHIDTPKCEDCKIDNYFQVRKMIWI